MLLDDSCIKLNENENKPVIEVNSKLGDITFSNSKGPVLVLKDDGSIFVQGRLTTVDRDVVEALKIFLGFTNTFIDKGKF